MSTNPKELRRIAVNVWRRDIPETKDAADALNACAKAFEEMDGKVLMDPAKVNRMTAALQRIVNLEPGSRGAYGKFAEAQRIAAEGLGRETT